MEPLPWESWVCDVAMRQQADERWAAFEVLLLVSRQNGKGTCLEIAELYALFVLGLNVYHTAHLMETARKACKRLWRLIERTPFLRRRVVGKPAVDSKDAITMRLVSGAFIMFMVRSARAGRGFDDCNILILDEALFLEAKTVEAILPAMSTNPHAQVWYTSSAGVVGSTFLRALVKRGDAGDPGMAYMNWSIAKPKRGEVVDPLDPAVVAVANPSLVSAPIPGWDGPIGITMDYVRGEYRVFTSEGDESGYFRERLGVFDEDPAAAKRTIPWAAWQARGGLVEPPTSEEVAFGIAASYPDADRCAIVVAGGFESGEVSVQVVEYLYGTSEVVKRCVELDEAHENVGFAIDPNGPAGPLIDDLEEAGVWLRKPTPREVRYWAAGFRSGLGVEQGDEPFVRHYDQDSLGIAVRSADRKMMGDGWLWERRGATDICPLEAASLAVGTFRRWALGSEAWAEFGE